MNKEIFIEELKKINIHINNEQLNMLEEYYNLLVDYNKKINLTRITKKEDVYLKHFYDSLTVNKVINISSIKNLCDIGTGAGFPGLVIAIIFPNVKVTLVDSLNKRIEFLNLVIKKLDLKNVITVHDRIENYAKQNEEKIDVITSRAVAKINILLELSVKMLKIDGYFIALKSQIEEEINEAKNSLKILNCDLIETKKFNLPIENSKRTILKAKKIKKTPEMYPRKFDKIKKKPL